MPDLHHHPGHDALRNLARKYRTLAELRRAKARGETPPAREVFRILALEFPGALRELDTVRLVELDARATALESAAAGIPGAFASWMGWLHGYHLWMRVALMIKPRVVRLANLEHEAAQRIASDVARRMGVDIELEFVTLIAKPPGGRIRPVVLARLAALHAVSIEEIRDALFPRHPGGTDSSA